MQHAWETRGMHRNFSRKNKMDKSTCET